MYHNCHYGPAFLQLGIVGVLVLLDSPQTPSPEVGLPVAMYISVQPPSSSPLSVRSVPGSPVGLVGNAHHVGPVGVDAEPDLSRTVWSVVNPDHGKVVVGRSHV